MEEVFVTQDHLLRHPDHIFVFGDNLERKGNAGAAKLRNMPNSYGFITKKYPNNFDESFFRPEEYKKVYAQEIKKLTEEIINNPNKIYLISKLGGGLANRFYIFEEVIQPNIRKHLNFENVRFLW